MTQWDNTLYSESKGFRLEFHLWARSGLGTQPHFKAHRDLQFVLEIELWLLTLGEWGCLLGSSPKLALGWPNGWQKVWTNFTFIVLIAVFDKQANIRCSISSIWRPISSRDHNATNQASAMAGFCILYFSLLENSWITLNFVNPHG